MINYIKWELKDYILSKYKWFIAIGIIFLFIIFVPASALDKPDNYIFGLIVMAYTITMLLSFLSSFYMGTKKIIDTFGDKTFLLESMIPFSVRKILLAKYILGIIINCIFIIIFIIGGVILILKNISLESAFEGFVAFMKSFDVSVFFALVLSTIAFMTLATLCYIISKVISPNSNNKIVGTILTIISVYTIAFIFSLLVELGEANIIYHYLACILVSVFSYIVSVSLIQNKLEIYN